jgi:hypothetical protein
MLNHQPTFKMMMKMTKKKVKIISYTFITIYSVGQSYLQFFLLLDLCLRKPSSLSELRRKQTTAVILMGVIGSEFGQEVNGSDNASTSSRSQSGSSVRRKSSIVEGFGIGNNNLSRLTSNLFFLIMIILI